MGIDPNKPVPGPYYDGEVGIYADHPQPVDHTRFRGFASPEPNAPGGGFLIAESIPHGPTRKMLAAAPELLAALEAMMDEAIPDSEAFALVNSALAKARGEA